MSAAIAIFGFMSLANGHSWIHCSDYRGDTANYEAGQCFGHPRPKGGAFPDAGAFGVDRGFDTQSGVCQSNDANAYTAQFPAATYKRGQTVTLAWPSKNHVAATCTNPFIPDTSTKLFVANVANTPTFTTQVAASFSDDPHVNGQIDFKGFQNCPDFCSNTDKSLCTGTFVVPANLADGTYSFQWEWVFNQGAAPYVSCFEATVAGDETNGGGGAGPAPVADPTPRPTPNPTSADEAMCGAMGEQCDGMMFGGANCCLSGLTCYREGPFLSMCLDRCPDDWECSETALTCAAKGEQCGGMHHTGPTCCNSGECYENSPYFSECRDNCPTEWACANEGQEFGTGGSGGMKAGLGVLMMFLILAAAAGGVLYGRYWERKVVAKGSEPGDLGKLGKSSSSLDGTSIPMTTTQARRSTLNMPKVDKPQGAPPAPPSRPPAPPAEAYEQHRVSVV